MRISEKDIEALELVFDVPVDFQPWVCDVLALMKHQILTYNALTPSENYHPRYRSIQGNERPKLLVDLLEEDLAYLSLAIPEVSAIQDRVTFVAFRGKSPDVTLWIDRGPADTATIAVSVQFIHFIHSFFSKFHSVLRETRYSGLAESLHEAISVEKWQDDCLFTSIIDDVVDYFYQDHTNSVNEYLFLYEPYDYCECVVAARRFAILHELAHFYLRLNNLANVDGYTEEFMADRLAYEWLLRTQAGTSAEALYRSAEAAMTMQGPLLFFLAYFYYFAGHCWLSDKEDVWSKRKPCYLPHPLKREMALISHLFGHCIFDRFPVLFTCMVGYFQGDVLAYDSSVFLTHRQGRFAPLGMMHDRPARTQVLELLPWAVADAYFALHPFDYTIAIEHARAVAWIGENACRSADGLKALTMSPRVIQYWLRRCRGVERSAYANPRIVFADTVRAGVCPERFSDILESVEKQMEGLTAKPPELSALLKEREEIQAECERLSSEKASLAAADYHKRLESLVVELAKIQEEIDQCNI